MSWKPGMTVMLYGADDWGDNNYEMNNLLEPKSSWSPIKWLTIGITIGYSVCRYMN